MDNVNWLVCYAAAIYWGASFFTEQLLLNVRNLLGKEGAALLAERRA